MSNLAYQDEIYTEMLDGNIIAMSPRPAINHNVVAENLNRIFGNYLKGSHCRAFGEVDVYLTQNDRVIPDLIIVCNRNIVKVDGIHGAPDLVVEILSPSTAKRDRGYKKNLYEKCSIKEYWLVDTKHRSIEVYLLINGTYVLDDIYAIFPDYLISKMTDEERDNIKHELKTSLYSDLIMSLDEIFDGMF